MGGMIFSTVPGRVTATFSGEVLSSGIFSLISVSIRDRTRMKRTRSDNTPRVILWKEHSRRDGIEAGGVTRGWAALYRASERRDPADFPLSLRFQRHLQGGIVSFGIRQRTQCTKSPGRSDTCA